VIRTLVAAGSAIARAGLARILRSDSRVTVVAEVTPAQLLQAIATFEPDVILEERESGELVVRAENVLPRDTAPGEIVAALVAVAARPPAANDGYDGLSARETEVLAQLARGAGNKQIAAALAISEHTVKFHVASIFAKLGVASRTEAVTQGVRRGLIML
jgi:DNA-binding NarL/FixJ family response regulator